MKVTVTFGDTAVVVPCKAGWTVRDLVDQATRRYRRVLEQHGDNDVRTHHLEYPEGGILDMDDMLGELVDDRDKLVALFDRVQHGRTDSPRENLSNYSSDAPSPEPASYYPHLMSQESGSGEIEVNEAVLKANTPLMVRSSSDSALAPSYERMDTPSPVYQRNGSPDQEISHVLKGALDRLHTDDPPAKMSKANFSTLTRTVEIAGDQGPLGIHVIPYCSSLSGRTLGLHIKGIEEKSLSKRENIFRDDECIVQINDTPLEDKTFAQSQEVFLQAMGTSTVRLEVVPVPNKLRYEKSLIGQLFTGDAKDLSAKIKSPMLVRPKTDMHPEPKPHSKPNSNVEVRRPDARAKTPEPPAAYAPADELLSSNGSSPTPSLRTESSSPASRSPVPPGPPGLANLSSKKGGKRLKIDLKKGTEGLGFTVVTRDSSVHGPGPILVKNILSRGAAVKDGRLQPGDRILEVNGVDMTGRSQEELEDIFLPRELKGEEASSVVLEDGREQLMYEIPLNESGSAGLGVSLKGNKSRETGEDLGIFIKSIIHGGAAYKDGRLTVNDQLVAVNGESLIGRSNHASMETLRRSMSSEGNARGTIQLVVLRAPRQMGSATSSSNSAPNVSTAHQSSSQTASSNQVRAGDVRRQLQPPLPPRCSSLLPALRRRASEPLPHRHRQRGAQRPGETHSRYTFGFNQRERRSGYTFGLGQREVEQREEEGRCDRPSTRHEFGFESHSQTLSRATERNLNRERLQYGNPRRRMLSDMQGHASLDNTHGHMFVDTQGGCGSRQGRSRTLDAIHIQDGYTENIRAMAGQMYGDPPIHTRIPSHDRNTHRCDECVKDLTEPSGCSLNPGGATLESVVKLHENLVFTSHQADAHIPRWRERWRYQTGQMSLQTNAFKPGSEFSRYLHRPPSHQQTARLLTPWGSVIKQALPEEPWPNDAYQKLTMNTGGHMTNNNYTHGSSGSAPHPTASTNGSYAHYGNEDEEPERDFPPLLPPAPWRR
ncbi:unnamed protein product [Pleuronectes platessa]|uniref:PDZ domain-containing protein n=1 Tax=Pleuronectes platessa TaxID=8262 RepID=A0A9N7VI90_PLEPL|nr:unnamed protein product [Pleuronectes platessa]